MYNFFEDEKPRLIIRVATTSTSVPLDPTYFDVACSFIHKVAARPNILPYIDMVKWVIDHFNIEDRTFKDSKGENIDSFRVEYLRTMYHLPVPQRNYEKYFLQIFREKHLDLMKLINKWNEDQVKLNKDKLDT